MIDREYNKLAFVCDNCGDGLVTGEGTWIGAKSVFTKQGWKAVSDGEGGFQHYCPDCGGGNLNRGRD